MVVRKTPQQIKEEILSCLSEKPLSIEEIRKKVESNWSTISSHLDELSKEGKVKEIVSTEKARVYQKIVGDTYFNIPITEDQRKKFRTLYYYIKQEYKEKNKIPRKTDLAKCAVYVIEEDSSELSDLPTAWYLYGAIPLLVADPSQNYGEEYNFEHKTKIRSLIKVYIKETCDKSVKNIQKKQHADHKKEMYMIADEFLDKAKSDWSNKEIIETLNRFFIACPIDNEFPEIFEYTSKFISTVIKLSNIGNLQDYKKEVLLCFDSLWKYIATYTFYRTLTENKRYNDAKSILSNYIGNVLEARRIGVEEASSDLYSVYLSKLPEINIGSIKQSAETQKIREIMEGWIGEE